MCERVADDFYTEEQRRVIEHYLSYHHRPTIKVETAGEAEFIVDGLTAEIERLKAQVPPDLATWASRELGYELLPWQAQWLHARVQVQIAMLDHATRTGVRPQVFMAGIPRPASED